MDRTELLTLQVSTRLRYSGARRAAVAALYKEPALGTASRPKSLGRGGAEVGDLDLRGRAAPDGLLDGGAGVVGVDVDAVEPVAAGDGDALADAGEVGLELLGVLLAAGQEVLHLEGGAASRGAGAGVLGYGVRPLGRAAARLGDGLARGGGGESPHAELEAARGRVDHAGAAQDLELLGGRLHGAAGHLGGGGEQRRDVGGVPLLERVGGG